MQTDYSKFLNAKLYLIEALSLKGMLAGDERMKEIHDICLSNLEGIENRLNNLNLGWQKGLKNI